MNKDMVSFDLGAGKVEVPIDVVTQTLLRKFLTVNVGVTAQGKIGAPLANGIYAGIARGMDGTPDQDLILLPGEFKGTWQDAIKWAEDQGGRLPTRREAALLFANLHDQFKTEYHWLLEPYEGDDACAWCQGFGNGYQHWDDRSDELYARAVRRI